MILEEFRKLKGMFLFVDSETKLIFNSFSGKRYQIINVQNIGQATTHSVFEIPEPYYVKSIITSNIINTLAYAEWS